MDPYPARDYDPIQPHGTDWRGLARKAFGPLVAAAIALAKWSFVLVKFGSIFIAVGGYALIWGWRFAVGLVALILLHELGHFIEAKREGLNPRLPVFIPFLGAYVRLHARQPVADRPRRARRPHPGRGGVARVLRCGARDRLEPADRARLLRVFLNLINLVPIGFFDGGAIWRSAGWLRRGGGAAKAYVTYALYVATAAALAVGMLAAYVPQHRL